MTSEFRKVDYSALNSRQQETYNFQKVAGKLADYGYSCMLLSDDWQGADFLAVHVNGTDILRVQLKSRLGIHEKYCGKELHIAFRSRDTKDIYVYPHDDVMEEILSSGRVANTAAWRDTKGYAWPYIPKWAVELLAPYKI